GWKHRARIAGRLGLDGDLPVERSAHPARVERREHVSAYRSCWLFRSYLKCIPASRLPSAFWATLLAWTTAPGWTTPPTTLSSWSAVSSLPDARLVGLSFVERFFVFFLESAMTPPHFFKAGA